MRDVRPDCCDSQRSVAIGVEQFKIGGLYLQVTVAYILNVAMAAIVVDFEVITIAETGLAVVIEIDTVVLPPNSMLLHCPALLSVADISPAVDVVALDGRSVRLSHRTGYPSHRPAGTDRSCRDQPVA